MVLNYKVVLVFALLAVSFLEGSAADSLRTERIGDRYFVIHRVEKEETLYSLSKRYNADLDQIIKTNGIINNHISLAQELKIPIKGEPDPVTYAERTTKKHHTVSTGETLYAISRRYGVTVDQLRNWNNLPSNEISVGQSLVVDTGSGKRSEQEELPEGEEVVENNTVAEDTGRAPESNRKDNPEASDVPEEFTVYYVQNGEMLGGIARKFNVRPDSIVIWNSLPNTYLSIGQKLLIKGEIDAELQKKAPNTTTTPYGTIRKSTDQSGFTRFFEEGIASKIDSSVETEKYLALHRSLPMGTLIEVRNLMNNKKVFVRVVGKLPETGLNENVLIRLTPVCFERLGVIDSRTRVEVSYYED